MWLYLWIFDLNTNLKQSPSKIPFKSTLVSFIQITRIYSLVLRFSSVLAHSKFTNKCVNSCISLWNASEILLFGKTTRIFCCGIEIGNVFKLFTSRPTLTINQLTILNENQHFPTYGNRTIFYSKTHFKLVQSTSCHMETNIGTKWNVELNFAKLSSNK